MDTDAGTDPDDSVAALLLRDTPLLYATNLETPAGTRSAYLAQLLALAGIGARVASGELGCKIPLVESTGLLLGPGHSPTAVHELERLLEAGVVDYLGMGALTNLAAVLRRRPDLAPRVRLRQMGPCLESRFARPKAQYNARVDPAAFRHVLETVPSPRLLLSHTTWQRYPSGRVQLGIYPDDPLGRALAASPLPHLQLLARHMALFFEDGKDCTIQHDPLLALSALHPGLVEWDPARLRMDETGRADLAEDGVEVRIAGRVDYVRARRLIAEGLLGNGSLAAEWEAYNSANRPV